MAEKSTQTNNRLFCSFCNKDNNKVGYLIVGPNDNTICDLCVELFYGYLDDPDYIGTVDKAINCSFVVLTKIKLNILFQELVFVSATNV